MSHLSAIRRAFSAHRPAVMPRNGRNEAAVAMVFREGEHTTEVLFIERAKHPDDPWSGHMAFPGGRRDPGDATVRQAAERETLEEVGVNLARAEHLGHLTDLEGYRGGRAVGLVISAFAYFHPDPESLVISDEVAEALWVPVGTLWEPSRQVEYDYRGAGPYPGIQVSPAGAHVVWGLTYRMVQNFLGVISADREMDLGPNP